MRASVSPPTAMHVRTLGHASAVSGSGVYAVVEAVKAVLPSWRCDTAPVPTGGVPIHLVPTMTQTRGDGQSTP